jgi:hypothetical protein
VHGRVTVKSQSGDSSPDTGAKIIAFPVKTTDAAKLPLAGFRPTATEADIQAAIEALRKLGGDMAIADETGAFHLALPAAGTYPILVLSHTRRRDVDKPVDAALKQLLEMHFEQPDSLPGEVRYHFSRVRYRGTGPEVWDYTFEGE